MILLSKTLMTLMAVSLLVGCNVGLTPDKDVPDENRQEILNIYEQVEGVYEGHLVKKDEAGTEIDRYEVEIRLFSISSFGSRNEDGRLASVPELIGQYRRKDAILATDDKFFQASYNEKTGFFEMVYSGQGMSGGGSGTNAAGGSASTHRAALSGFIFGNQIVNAQYRIRSGIVGQIEAQRINRKVIAPSERDLTDLRQRLSRFYAPLLGDYQGRVIEPAGIMKYDLRIRIYLVDDPFSGSVNLKARIHMKDMQISSDRWADVTYYAETGEIWMEGQANPAVGNVPGAGYFSASGFLRNNQLELNRMADHLGPMGQFKGKKEPFGTRLPRPLP